jgi:hypothetical protein
MMGWLKVENGALSEMPLKNKCSSFYFIFQSISQAHMINMNVPSLM